MQTLFQEKQRFTQWWLWLLLIGLTLIPLYGVYQQLLRDQPAGDKPMSDWGLLAFLLFMLLFLLFFWLMQLSTTITAKTIHFRFFPVTNQQINWEDIEAAEVLNYGFVGGWGIRIGTQYGTIYNTSGKIGLALRLKNGKKICVGTQEQDALKKVIAVVRQQYGIELIESS